MKLLLIVAAATAALLFVWNRPAWAVEGYKQFKFGMSKGEVRNIGGCLGGFRYTFDSSDGSILGCLVFPFGGGYESVDFFFVNGELLRVEIRIELINGTDRQVLLEQLKEKYGEPLPQKQKKRTRVDRITGTYPDVKFDGGTIILRQRSKILMRLIYTSPRFDQEWRKRKAEALKGDL